MDLLEQPQAAVRPASTRVRATTGEPRSSEKRTLLPSSVRGDVKWQVAWRNLRLRELGRFGTPLEECIDFMWCCVTMRHHPYYALLI